MKALLRTSIVALIAFAGYSAVKTDIHKTTHAIGLPQPQCVPGSASACAVAK